jgi:hypothetical protein
MQRYYVLIFMLVLVLSGCSWSGGGRDILQGTEESPDHLARQVEIILAGYDKHADFQSLEITYPYDGAMFPPEISAPTVNWNDSSTGAGNWLIKVSFTNDHPPIYAFADKKTWEPDRTIWETIKVNAIDNMAKITVLGLDKKTNMEIISRGTVQIGTAPVGVDAAILFRQVPLPFPVNNINEVKWSLGDISSYLNPRVIMENLPMCSSCHVVSLDGKYLSMEMNYGNDSGAQFISPVRKKMVINKNDFFSWNDYPRQGILPKTRGLFARMSPSGRYVIGSVNEISLALLTNDYTFSQVFFPTYGILAYYTVADEEFRPLPGADDYAYVQTNPNWSPEEEYIVFARALTKNEVHDDITDVSPKRKNADIYTLNKQYNIQFDLYRIPFNNGLGGTPLPLEGGSMNGMSNYFPRHSPDGKWIVFTQSKTGIMLQPDSQLYIIPAGGGEPRRMKCNRELFNSWHSWSPNSRWLLFSSKVNTPFTEIFLTYVDETGKDHPPVLLSRFSDPRYAANVPEFVNIKPDAIRQITVK